MLLLILGTDDARIEARRKALEPFVLKETLMPSSVTVDLLQALAQSQSLFGDVRAYSVSGLFEDEQKEDEFAPLFQQLSASTNLFVFEEQSGAALAKAVEKAGGKVVKTKVAETKQRADPFALAQALGRKDKKQLWLLYREALEEGAAPEMLIGMLAWKARQMASRGESGAKVLSRDIVTAYHESRRGAGDMELLLERLILTL